MIAKKQGISFPSQKGKRDAFLRSASAAAEQIISQNQTCDRQEHHKKRFGKNQGADHSRADAENHKAA